MSRTGYVKKTGPGHQWEVTPVGQGNLLSLGEREKLTLRSLIGVDPWLVIVSFGIGIRGMLLWMEKIEMPKWQRAKKKNSEPRHCCLQ